jgi:uncharacterized membrane protein YagU involved in acid resistance
MQRYQGVNQMTTAVSTRSQNPSLVKSAIAGAIAGLGGGAVFGIMMGMMGMLPMVAMLAGSQDPLIGLGVHMAISAVIGAIYGVVAGRLPQSVGMGMLAGAANGVVWWVLGALVMMPMMLGMSNMVLQFGQAQWMSLVGHLLFGVVTGLLFIPLSKRL